MILSIIHQIVNFIKSLFKQKTNLSNKEAAGVEFTDMQFIDEQGNTTQAKIEASDSPLVSSFDNVLRMPTDIVLVIKPRIIDAEGAPTDNFDKNISWSLNKPEGGKFVCHEGSEPWCTFKPTSVGTFEIAILIDSDISVGEKALLGYITVIVENIKTEE